MLHRPLAVRGARLHVPLPPLLGLREEAALRAHLRLALALERAEQRGVVDAVLGVDDGQELEAQPAC